MFKDWPEVVSIYGVLSSCANRKKHSSVTMLVRNHVKPTVAGSGKVKPNNIEAIELCHAVPGHGDHNSLKLGFTSGVITPGGYRYLITGSSKSPNIKYVGCGDDPDFGKYVE